MLQMFCTANSGVTLLFILLAPIKKYHCFMHVYISKYYIMCSKYSTFGKVHLVDNTHSL